MRPEARYAQFHGRPVPRKRRMGMHTPTHLITLGEAVAIEYRCDKFNGGGDGTKAVYRHLFKKGVKVFMDERAGGMLYVGGNKIKVTEAGIEN